MLKNWSTYSRIMIDSTLKKIFNALGFQGAWWLCVFGALWGLPYLGPIAMLIFLVFHMLLMGKGKNELIFLILMAVVGTVVDSLKASSGFISYMGGYGSVTIVAPLWITAMWAGFAATINHSLYWIHSRYYLAFIIGAIFGPLAYMVGVKLQALSFNYSVSISAILLAAVWGVSVSSMYWISKKLGLSPIGIQ